MKAYSLEIAKQETEKEMKIYFARHNYINYQYCIE